MLPVKRLSWMVALAILLIAGLALTLDHFNRCNGQPLSKEEATVRAADQLERYKNSFKIDEAMPLEESKFDPDTKAWLFTYTGRHCSVIIIVDRCHGDEVGGTNACKG